MCNDKKFVLGVGAQKAGTTWLHQYINQNETANMGFKKEYHIWDAVSSPLCAKFRVTAQSLLLFRKEKLLRYFMQNIPGFYERYFKEILNHQNILLTGDITPSYSILSSNELKMLRKRIQYTGACVRCVFLMRDPVERCWSAARMHLRIKQLPPENHEKVLRNAYQTKQFAFRTRYEDVCENLKSVFAENELYFGFYETMFDKSEIYRLSRFLGIPPNMEFKKNKYNVSEKTSFISDGLRKQVKDYYLETYRYCQEMFPITREIWG